VLNIISSRNVALDGWLDWRAHAKFEFSGSNETLLR
jgi:hypothetical protein